MNVLFHIFIFIIIVFLYIHITQQYKKGEDLEIYEMDYSTNKQLQEVCDLKQPILFQYSSLFPEFIEDVTIDSLISHGSYDVKVKDITDFWKDNENVDSVILPMKSSHNLMVTDTNSRFFTENNDDFIQESGFSKKFQENDSFLKPSDSIINTKYDIISGSNNAVTPLRYHTNYRQFLLVNQCKITIKMTPYKSHKYLHVYNDYDNFEFRSPINVWNPQSQYQMNMEKLKFLEFQVNPGYIIYIPPYWWYSIKFSGNSENLICGFTYHSIFSSLANIPNYVLYFIQQNNIKKKITKTLEIPTNTNESML